MPIAARWPLLGSLPQLARFGMLPFLERSWREHGDTFRVEVAGRSMVVLVHPSAVERVLVSHRDNYVKGRTYAQMRLLTGQGLLTLEGAAWRSRRRLEQPAFHRESIRKLTGRMVDAARALLVDWRRRIPAGGVVEMHHEMLSFTLGIVCDTLFGQTFNGGSVAQTGRAFGDALTMVFERGQHPLHLPLAIPTPSNLRFRRARKLLDELVFRTIDRARAAQADSDRSTLLSMLLDARDAESGAGLSDIELRDEVITLFLAGHETTALLLTWGLILLDQHPDIVAEIRAELQAVVGERQPDADDIPKLVYLRQVIDEILRLRSPVWTVGRDVVADDVIDGLGIRASETVLPLTYLTHRHPEFWDDPERFDPGRFSPARSQARNRWAYYPFSVGPRICIGNVFSLVESQVALATLLQQIDCKLVPGQRIEPVAKITLRPSAPVHMALRWRA